MDDCTKAIYNDEIYFKFDEVVMHFTHAAEVKNFKKEISNYALKNRDLDQYCKNVGSKVEFQTLPYIDNLGKSNRAKFISEASVPTLVFSLQAKQKWNLKEKIIFDFFQKQNVSNQNHEANIEEIFCELKSKYEPNEIIKLIELLKTIKNAKIKEHFVLDPTRFPLVEEENMENEKYILEMRQSLCDNIEHYLRKLCYQKNDQRFKKSVAKFNVDENPNPNFSELLNEIIEVDPIKLEFFKEYVSRNKLYVINVLSDENFGELLSSCLFQGCDVKQKIKKFCATMKAKLRISRIKYDELVLPIFQFLQSFLGKCNIKLDYSGKSLEKEISTQMNWMQFKIVKRKNKTVVIQNVIESMQKEKENSNHQQNIIIKTDHTGETRYVFEKTGSDGFTANTKLKESHSATQRNNLMKSKNQSVKFMSPVARVDSNDDRDLVEILESELFPQWKELDACFVDRHNVLVEDKIIIKAEDGKYQTLSMGCSSESSKRPNRFNSMTKEEKNDIDIMKFRYPIMFDRTGRNLILEGFPAWLNKGKRKLKPNEANLKKYLDEMDANTIDSYKTICSFSIFMSLHYDNKVWARLLASMIATSLNIYKDIPGYTQNYVRENVQRIMNRHRDGMILDKNCLLPVVSVYLIEVDILCGCFQNIIDFLFDDHRGKDSHVEFRDHLSHLAKLANKIHGYFHLRNIKEKEKIDETAREFEDDVTVFLQKGKLAFGDFFITTTLINLCNLCPGQFRQLHYAGHSFHDITEGNLEASHVGSRADWLSSMKQHSDISKTFKHIITTGEFCYQHEIHNVDVFEDGQKDKIENIKQEEIKTPDANSTEYHENAGIFVEIKSKSRADKRLHEKRNKYKFDKCSIIDKNNVISSIKNYRPNFLFVGKRPFLEIEFTNISDKTKFKITSELIFTNLLQIRRKVKLNNKKTFKAPRGKNLLVFNSHKYFEITNLKNNTFNDISICNSSLIIFEMDSNTAQAAFDQIKFFFDILAIGESLNNAFTFYNNTEIQKKRHSTLKISLFNYCSSRVKTLFHLKTFDQQYPRGNPLPPKICKTCLKLFHEKLLLEHQITKCTGGWHHICKNWFKLKPQEKCNMKCHDFWFNLVDNGPLQDYDRSKDIMSEEKLQVLRKFIVIFERQTSGVPLQTLKAWIHKYNLDPTQISRLAKTLIFDPKTNFFFHLENEQYTNAHRLSPLSLRSILTAV